MSGQLPIVQFWHSPERPTYIDDRIASFSRLNPTRPHLVFDEHSAEEFIAERFGPRELAAFRACGPPAMQADYLRCCAILKLGGAWVDAGMTCVRSLDSLIARTAEGTLFRWPAPYFDVVLMNALFAFPTPGHPFLRMSIEVSTELIQMRWRGAVNEVTGPLVMTVIYGLARAGATTTFLEAVRRESRLSAHHVRYAEVVSEVIGDSARAVEACAGISVLRPGTYRKWALGSSRHLPHRASSDYWPKLRTDIYTGTMP